MLKRTVLNILLFAISLTSIAKSYHVFEFGAKGNATSDDASAIQQAIDACSCAGGGDVIFDSNHTFLSGPVQLKSNVNIILESNAIWKANPNDSVYHKNAFGDNQGEGKMWIWAKDVENLSISGHGTIHGNGLQFMGQERSDSYQTKPYKTFDPRPHVLTLIGVKNLQIRDITIQEGAYWTVHLAGCNRVVIDGINLLNNLKIPNGDGIDIDHSKHVRIANCYITSGDDAICLKNRREFREYGGCHDIVVTNCIMESRSCTVKIGSENTDSIYNVMISNCVIKGSNRGLGIQNRDEGTVTNVVFSNIILECRLWSDVWWGKAEPIYVTSYPRANASKKGNNWRFPKGQTVGKCGEVSQIYFNNIYATSENGCFIGGDTRGKVHDIFLNNVHLDFKKLTNYVNGVYDKRPCCGEAFIQDKVYGVYIDQAENVKFDGLKIKADPKVEFGGNIFKHN